MIKFFINSIILFFFLSGSVSAWQSIEARYFYGTNFKLQKESHGYGSLQYAGGNNYGEVFSFLDIDSDDYYGEAYGYIKITDNWFLSGGVNGSSQFTEYLAGTTYKINTNFFNLFQIEQYVTENNSNIGSQSTVVWIKDHKKWVIRGFIDVLVNRDTNASTSVFSQPEFLYKVSNNFYAGTRLQFWINKFGVKGVNEFAPSLMLKYDFY